MHEETDRIPLVEERLTIAKREVPDGLVRIRTTTDTTREVVGADLVSHHVDVERVAVNEVVDEAPRIRTEGDVTIVPVREERLVVEKRLVLVEEIRIRRRSTFRPERVEADLRKQTAVIERINADETPRRNQMADLYNENAQDFAASTGTSTLTAFFDSRSDAENAAERLKDAGIAESAIRFMPGSEADSGAANVASDDRPGFWASLEDWFFPDADRATYAEGLRRGGFLISVQVDDANYETTHDILDDEGSIDMDERADTWRTEGWEAQRSNEAYASSTYDASQRRKFDDDLDGVVQSTAAAREDTFDDGSHDETIPVVEENLRVGKRDVNHGSVRVRAYTVEQPVRENVSLRDENVEIERQAVDRPLTDADRAFEDRTISAEERHEEAVVSKDARVVEEIGIRKRASDRTETIDDTVRKTEVEVDDERSRSQSQSGPRQSQGQGFRRE